MMLGEIRNNQGELLDCSIHRGKATIEDVVLIGHGVTGNKDRPFVVALAEGLAAAGMSAIRFSFAGNGDSQGRFVDSTVSKEVDDLGSVITAVAAKRVSYIGHSMGAAVGVIRAARDLRIARLVSLAGMVYTAKFAEVEFGDVVPGEGCMWEEPDCPLSQEYIDDMKGIGSVVERGAEVGVPWLLVHGSADDVVPVEESTDIAKRAGENSELFLIDGADHVFNQHTDAMVGKVVGWLAGQLCS